MADPLPKNGDAQCPLTWLQTASAEMPLAREVHERKISQLIESLECIEREEVRTLLRNVAAKFEASDPMSWSAMANVVAVKDLDMQHDFDVDRVLWESTSMRAFSPSHLVGSSYVLAMALAIRGYNVHTKYQSDGRIVMYCSVDCGGLDSDMLIDRNVRPKMTFFGH